MGKASTVGSRDHGIEGLRGLAAYSVLIAHCATIFATAGVSGGYVAGQGFALMTHGVTLFFVLSGYLLYLPFARNLIEGHRAPSIRTFYRNRVLRIYPAFLVILAVSGFVLGTTVIRPQPLGVDVGDRLGYLTDPILLLKNLTLTHGYFASSFDSGISPSWSLVPEIAFYAVLPATWLLARRLRGHRTGTRAALLPPLLLIVLGTIGYAAAVVLMATQGDNALFASTWPAVFLHSFPATCELFGFGMLIAVVVTALRAPQCADATVRRARRLAVVALALAAVGYFPALMLKVPYYDVGIACAALVLLTVAPGGGRIQDGWIRFLESAPVARAGLISYGVYLWHYPLALFLRREFPDLAYGTWGGMLVALLVMAASTTVLSVLTYRFVEKPALAHKKSMVATEAPAPVVSQS
ncbi:acyltransferase family protein [Nocardioides cavernaquae]|uniref:Acyltransferase n=1 Tax=Nocardioides cavernaquae TaxID=2321396 RepID=A0A3A5H3Z1_9ACTN|nr:acyltransferase [Nocardioides cavernaquae]RJS45352.1 acyltransferase [Nocardioides cavernaquae]